MTNRRWYTGLLLIPMSAGRTFSMLRRHNIGGLGPLFVLLLLGSVVMWMANAIAPLAPFVYSLF